MNPKLYVYSLIGLATFIRPRKITLDITLINDLTTMVTLGIISKYFLEVIVQIMNGQIYITL